jgi:EmrB/QacA subfamily drug resistance transporter
MTLAASVLGSSMAFIDGSVVNVSLPAIMRDVGGSAMAAQWVMNGYLVMLAALILVGGAAADRFGRRAVFQVGVVIFATASVACAFAHQSAELIAARVLQGAGGALLIPASLALLGATFPESERGRAIGAWAGYGALTTAAGPVLGGFLTDTLSWRAVFYINVPLALGALWLSGRYAPESRRAGAPPLDWVGAVLATAGVGCLAWSLTSMAGEPIGTTLAMPLLAAGLVLTAAFLLFQMRSPAPMVPPALFRSRQFSGANLLTLLLYFALGGTFFFLPFELIRGRGYSVTAAAAALLPLPILVGLFSRWAGDVADKFGPRWPLAAGPVVAALGLALLAVPARTAPYWLWPLPGLIVVAAGMTVTVAPLTAAVMNAVDRDTAGTASGINNALARLAGVLAVAGLGIVFVDAYRSELARELSLWPGLSMSRLPAEIADPLSSDSVPAGRLGDAARAAMFHAFQSVTLAAALCALAAGIVGWLSIQRINR